jgi:hypothetical protein
MTNIPNSSINCTVGQCQFNCAGSHCSLESVNIGTHEANPTQPQCVDCNSFRCNSN